MTELKKFGALVSRNIKCYFKDKFLFFVSMITPMILLVLFVTFLRGVYIDSFRGILAQFQFEAEERILNGLAGSWLLSSVASVCAVTVAITSNAVMIQDKIDGTVNDFRISPVKGCGFCVSGYRGLVYFLCGRAGDFCRYVVLCVVRHPSCKRRRKFCQHTGRAVRIVDVGVQHVRVHLRSIYAFVAVCKGDAQRFVRASRHLQRGHIAQTFYERIH